MIRTRPRRATLVAGALALGAFAATVPAPSAQAVSILPTCTISLSGIPQVGQQLTTTLTVNAVNDLLTINLPVSQAVITVPAGAIPSLPTNAGTARSQTYTVLPSDVGSKLVALGQIRPVLTTDPLGPVLAALGIHLTSPIWCTPAETPIIPPLVPPVIPPVIPPGVPPVMPPSQNPVVLPPEGSAPGALGATPVPAAPRVVGRFKGGKLVRADVGSLPSGVTAGFQWFAARKHQTPTAIPGGTGSTYRLARSLRGAKVFVVVTYTRVGSTPTALTTAAKKVR